LVENGVNLRLVWLPEGPCRPCACGWQSRLAPGRRLPVKGLGGKTPLEFADTETGAREVENMLGRIEDGVVY